jgi:hypothetical protein
MTIDIRDVMQRIHLAFLEQFGPVDHKSCLTLRTSHRLAYRGSTSYYGK